MAVEAKLKRQDSNGDLQDWQLAVDSASPTGFSDPVGDHELYTRVGDTTDTEATGDGTAIAILKRTRTLLGQLDTKLASLDGKDYATETTLGNVDSAVGSVSDSSTLSTVIGRLKRLVAILENETLTASVSGTVDVADADARSSLSSIDTQLGSGTTSVSDSDTRSSLSSIDSKLPSDVATETTLDAVKGNTDQTTSAVKDGVGEQTDPEATGDGSLIAINKRFRTLLANVDTDLGASTDAEATGDGSLIAIAKRVRTVLESLDAKDFATETTLATLATESTLSGLSSDVGDPTDAEATADGSVIALLKRLRTRLGETVTRLTTLRDNQFRRTDPLAAGTNTIGTVVPDPPSDGDGRTHVQAAVAVQTADVQVYNVTAGKTLHVIGLLVVVHSMSATSSGELQLTDGAGGDLLLACPVPASIDATAVVSQALSEPLHVSDSVEAVEADGSIRYSVTLTGYEV